MQKYYSKLSILDGDQGEGIFCKGRGWHIEFESNPSSDTLVGPNHEPAKEIVVCASSVERAQYVVDLIFAAYCLLVGESMADEPNRVFPKQPDTAAEIEEQILSGGGHYIGVFHLPVACLIASKASQRVAYQYAIFKYLVSHQTKPLAADALDPRHSWEMGRMVSSFPEEHVFNASAIILGYSVLEELALEIRASNSNPSKLANGQWNPSVKDNLESRLLQANIDLSEQILWHLRDTPTKIERTKQPVREDKCEWSQGRVRDVYIDVIDAIAYASWLRSTVSAHKLAHLSKSLTICDVANVQHLARRLLLEVLGFWRYWQRNSK